MISDAALVRLKVTVGSYLTHIIAQMYRAWIICDRRWATILPTIVLWCTTVATMIAYLYRMTVTEEATVTGEEKRMAPMLVVIYSTTLTNNFICTGMPPHMTVPESWY